MDREPIHLFWAIVATIGIIAGSFLTNEVVKTPEERAFSRCVASGSESSARIACAEAIFGKKEIVQ